MPAPALAEEDLETAPAKLLLKIPNDTPGERCTLIEPSDAAMPLTVSLHRTLHDDFDEHPLLGGRWLSHYTDNVEMPESFYAAGEGSDLRRKSKL